MKNQGVLNMNDFNETVSIVVPTYKREPEYLNRAIESLLQQTYPNIEIVVIDDNPINSEWREKVTLYMKKKQSDSNITYIQNENNLGGALSRNVGIEKAKGNYITFLDDDDEYLPEKIEKQLNYMKKNNLDMTFTDLKIVNEKKIVIDYRDHSHVKSFKKNDLLKSHIMRKLTGTPTFMYKAGPLKAIGGFDDVPVGQEFHLMLKTIEKDLKIGYLKRADVIAYRHNEGGISFGNKKIKGEKEQYQLIKDKYFHLFSFREKMFIRFRYHAVFAISYKRNKQYGLFIINALLAVLSSPLDFLLEGSKFARTFLSHR